MEVNKIYQHNVLDPWPLPDKSVNCIVTSVPYWGLRDYGVEGQIGLEGSFDLWLDRMVAVFREAWRVLKDDGTLWLNVGDAYSSAGKWGGSTGGKHAKGLHGETSVGRKKRDWGGLKPKDLIGIPWMLAFALRNEGWFLRQDIIWSKSNAMPESVLDRCTRSHEYIFMFTKAKRYFYDAAAIRTPAAQSSIARWDQNIDDQEGSDRQPGKMNGTMKAVGGPRRSDKQRGHGKRHAGFNDRWDQMTTAEQAAMGANRRSVWTMATSGFHEAHFATFPTELPELCIKAGCPADGVVLDPFMGAGTTAVVAGKLQRKWVGLELNPKYIAIAEKRLQKELGLFR